MRVLALAGTCLALMIGALAAPAAFADSGTASCGNFQSFGTLTQNTAPYEVSYYLYSGGGAFTATMSWGDGHTTTVSVGALNTPANAVALANTYAHYGSYAVSISTVGQTSDGSPCTDVNVPLGTIALIPTGPLSCGSFAVFDPGTVSLTAGDKISYQLASQDATLTSASLEWGDGAITTMPAALPPNDEFSFSPHAYTQPGTFDVVLNVSGTIGDAVCQDRVKLGTVVVKAQAAASTLTVVVAQQACNTFLRKAKGRVGVIIRSGIPKTVCGDVLNKDGSRSCTTTVVVKKKCGCKYTIKTRVPATGKPKIIRITRKRLGGGRVA